jgi:hypothetical protein
MAITNANRPKTIPARIFATASAMSARIPPPTSFIAISIMTS